MKHKTDNENLTSELESASGRIDELKNENNTLKEAALSVEQELNEKNFKIEELAKEIDSKNKQLDATLTQNNKAKDNITELQKVKDDLEKEITDAR